MAAALAGKYGVRSQLLSNLVGSLNSKKVFTQVLVPNNSNQSTLLCERIISYTVYTWEETVTKDSME